MRFGSNITKEREKDAKEKRKENCHSTNQMKPLEISKIKVKLTRKSLITIMNPQLKNLCKCPKIIQNHQICSISQKHSERPINDQEQCIYLKWFIFSD